MTSNVIYPFQTRLFPEDKEILYTGRVPIVKDKKDVKRKLELNKYNTSSKILNHAPAAELATHLPHRWIASAMHCLRIELALLSNSCF